MGVKLNKVCYSCFLGTPLEKKVINNISLDIADSKITAISGSSGSGKTTLLKLIAGLIKPYSGSISVNDTLIESNNISNVKKFKYSVHMVMQYPSEHFFKNIVQKELEFSLKYLKKDNLKDKCTTALKMVGLDDSYLNRSPFELSLGEQKKLSLASLLTFDPDVLILDEPVAFLDAAGRKQIIKLLKSLKIKNKTIIVASNDTDFLHEIADYVVLMHNGKIIKKGNKYDVFSDKKVLRRSGVCEPKIMEFVDIVKQKKNVDIGYRDDINDVMKDIYRYVR